MVACPSLILVAADMIINQTPGGNEQTTVMNKEDEKIRIS